MTLVVRFVQVLLGLLAVLVAAALIMALGSQDTGLVEKVVLVMVAALCVCVGGFHPPAPRYAASCSSPRVLTAALGRPA